MNYAARISLDRTQMRIEDKLVNLTTRNGSDGPRRIISYPLVRYGQESLRE